jgi:hypothetical protein
VVHQHEIHHRPQVTLAPAGSLVSRRSRNILNGVAIHRTSLPPFIRARAEVLEQQARQDQPLDHGQDNEKRRGPVHGEARQQDRRRTRRSKSREHRRAFGSVLVSESLSTIGPNRAAAFNTGPGVRMHIQCMHWQTGRLKELGAPR